jgi:UDP-N-acetylmuramoyl-tripeptide--D-alanyl-D-alanine ligase
MRQENGLTVIDDAFNSNPVGAANAVEVLSSMHGRRIIITPGMIELGQREEELNTAFGRQIADGADEAVLVGPERTRPIREGLVAAGFPEDHIHTVRTLFEAREWLSRHARPGDTVLYENDLPDQFTEAST